MNLNAYQTLFVNESGSPLPEGGVRLTFFGTTMCLLDDGETQLLLDAHLTRPGMLRVLLGRLKTDAAFVDEVLRRFPMDRLRAIFLSHTHYDHALDAAYIAQKTGADLYGTVSAKTSASAAAFRPTACISSSRKSRCRSARLRLRFCPRSIRSRRRSTTTSAS